MSSDRSDDEAEEEEEEEPQSHSNGDGKPQNYKPSAKNKDPGRPKRKKARRACLACQRAHLTCGDERPCNRCIKRGLQDSCHDGHRKKAKYLHDAPDDTLQTGLRQGSQSNGNSGSPEQSRSSVSGMDVTTPTASFAGSSPYKAFSGMSGSAQLSRQMSNKTTQFPSFPPQQLQTPNPFANPQANTMPDMSSSMYPVQGTVAGQQYVPPLFDANDPSSLNFDVASMNFGNINGALEFGMLGQMSSDPNGGIMQPPSKRTSANFDYSPTAVYDGYSNTFNLSPGMMNTDWQLDPGANEFRMAAWNPKSQGQQRTQSHSRPHAYSIGAVTNKSAGGSRMPANMDSSNSDANYSNQNLNAGVTQKLSSNSVPAYLQKKRPPQSDTSTPNNGPKEEISKQLAMLNSAPAPRRRTGRDPSTVYSAVNKPYPYTAAFHALFAVLGRRLSTQNRLAVAKAFASYRPSLISCMRTLVDEDLLFMERCFQRQLCQYEDFVSQCGTPTIVCRRTGEVAYVGKEFTLLSGWTESVLLGREPNLNVNFRNSGTSANSGSESGNSRGGGVNTPREVTTPAGAANRPQPVFLAELLDEGSVVQFYEDFAKLAFADSKGSVSRYCDVLRYKTKEAALNDVQYQDQRSAGRKGKEGKDWRVPCMYCWTVKRDVFEVPMTIVLNFLPLM